MISAMLDWDVIDDLATTLGVKPDARRKWRERNHVPYFWRLRMIEASAESEQPIRPSDFPAPPPLQEAS